MATVSIKITLIQFIFIVQVIIVDPNRSGYFNYRALAVVSRERYSGPRKFREVQVHCTEANVLQNDTIWLPSRSLDMEIWSASREVNMRIHNKLYDEHVKNFQGAPSSLSHTHLQHKPSLILTSLNQYNSQIVFQKQVERLVRHRKKMLFLKIALQEGSFNFRIVSFLIPRQMAATNTLEQASVSSNIPLR